MRGFIVLLSLLGVSRGDIKQQLTSMYHHTYHGDGTYYGTGTGGTCSYGPTSFPPVASMPSITDHVALNKPQFMNSMACGMCFKVTGTGSGAGNNPITGTHIVFVKDLCPECVTGSVDFAKDGDGRWNVNIQAIQCPVGNTKIEYKFQGSNPWYLKLQVRNARIPAVDVQIQNPDGSWHHMTHSADGFWLLPGSGVHKPVHTPFNIKLTAINGEVLQDTIPSMQNEHIIHGKHHVQFSQDPHLPTH